MTIAVFAGPSLDRADASVPGITYLPPAAEGDIYRAARQGPRAIGLIDGYFEAQPAVWHKEILWAMSEGIHVFGAASMGALRAAELWSFGMVGAGVIYRAYRRGTLIDDAEVAVLHGPAELGYPSVTEALVNVRANLSRARARGVLSNEARRRRAAERDRDLLQGPHLGAHPGQGGRRRRRERRGRAAQGLAQEEQLRSQAPRCGLAYPLGEGARGDASIQPLRVSYAFEDTSFWQELIDRHTPDDDEEAKSAQ